MWRQADAPSAFLASPSGIRGDDEPPRVAAEQAVKAGDADSGGEGQQHHDGGPCSVVRVPDAKRAFSVVTDDPASVARVFDQPVGDEGRVGIPKADAGRVRG